MGTTLTDAKIRSIKGNGKRRQIPFGDRSGLYLIVSPKGGKSWVYKYRYGGKQKDFQAAEYPVVTIVEAKSICLEARRKVASGIDPNAEKKERKETEKREAEI